MELRLIAFGNLLNSPFERQWEFYGEWALQEMQQTELCFKKNLRHYKQHFGHHFTGVWNLSKYPYFATAYFATIGNINPIGAEDVDELVYALDLYYQELFNGLRLV